MKTLRRGLSLIIALCLLIAPIHASALEDNETQIDTAEKLIAAIEAANDGDTITIIPAIVLENITISTDKDLTIVRDTSDEKHMTKSLFLMGDSSSIEGLKFSDNSWCMGSIRITGVDTSIIDCTFEGNGSEDEEYMNEAVFILGGASTLIDSCKFSTCNGHALLIEDDAEVIIDNTVFSNNVMGSIANDGTATLSYCTVTGGETVENSGTMTLNDCVLYGNTPGARVSYDVWNSDNSDIYINHSEITDRIYYNRRTGELLTLPFHASGEIYIHSSTEMDEVKIRDKSDIRDYYDFMNALEDAEDGDMLVINGVIWNGQYRTDKHLTLKRHEDYKGVMFTLYSNGCLEGFTIIDSLLSSPSVTMSSSTYDNEEITIRDCTFLGDTENIGKEFIRVTNYSKSIDHLIIEESNFSEIESVAISNSDKANITNCVFADAPPEDNDTGDNTDNPENPPNTPSDENPDNSPADNGENSGNPPENPEDTGNGDNNDNPAPDDNNTEDNGESDTTPETSEQPTQPSAPGGNSTHRPTPTPTQTTTPPVEDEPAEQPQEIKPKFSCNGATLDITRSVVLQGYGDGQQHENDILTRAQLATIVYRLLDDDSAATLEAIPPTSYLDVDSSAWYAPYIDVISRAGIVYGIGAGRFDPNAPLTWAQLITVFTRFVAPQEYTLQYIKYPSWASEAMQTAAAIGWIADKPYFKADTAVTRGDAAAFINYVLTLSQQP